ncbi:MAG: hypothetical protein ABL898_11485 [Hyphomicrobiaceae bacterium]|nr:hypothetical protein [Hyphomicrobiaceae bacterium]
MAVLEYLQSLLANLGLTAGKVPYIAAIAAGLFLLFMAKSLFGRIGKVIEELFFSNWRLALLGTTGVVLSLASGWTTWDGMKNFTGEPILSAMVTFGIQGVMLIVAWLIGESFATGMNQIAPKSSLNKQAFGDGIGLKAALSLTLVGIAVLAGGGIAHLVKSGVSDDLPRTFAYIGGAILAVGLLIVATRAHTLRGYFDASRVMVKTAVLWVMFLACMATSVFFSFDSLFSTIFPQSERVRSAELRAQNQVAGIVADIGGMIIKSQLSESERLFQTEGWKAYDVNLVNLGKAAQASQGEIERYFQEQMELRRRGIAQQQERITSSQSGQAGLSAKKLSLSDELSRLRGERPALAEDFGKRKTDVETFMKELDAKRVEALAESRGVEGTGKAGEGPMFRQRKSEEAAVKDKIKIAEERLKDAQKRFQAVESRLTTIERELSVVDGDIAKLKGEAQTAEQRIKLAEEAKTGEEGPKLDPSRVLPAFEKARAEFRQTPKAELLAQVQSMCTQLLGAMTSAPTTKERVRGIDCDPKTAAEASARVFALNTGIVAFEMGCAGGDKLALQKSVDDLFGFSRKCVQDSGLGSKETEELRQKINFIELNRDDKANRFVVTWNAFQDGNRLAYLALAIAIAIDSLVFMSGLFGANAVRSPLSDVPTNKARSAEQLEGIIDNALLPHRFDNARMTVEAMHPDTSREGYTAVVDLRELDPQGLVVVRKVLNAGASIGAVHRDEYEPAKYFVRPELYEYLSISGAKAFEKHGKLVKEDIGEKVRLNELEKMVAVALMPDVRHAAEVVMSYTHPMNATDDGFMSEILMNEVEAQHILTVRGVLNAGAAHRAVRREKGETHRYEVHSDLYKTLARLRARMMMSSSGQAMQIGGAAVASHGGVLPASSLRPQLTAQFAKQPDIAPKVVQVQRPTTVTHIPVMAEALAEARGLSDFEIELVVHFAEQTGISRDTIEYVAQYGEAVNVAALKRGLDAVKKCDEGLGRYIRLAEVKLLKSFDIAIERFDAPRAKVEGWHNAFNEFAELLKVALPIYLLSPNGEYDKLLAEAIEGLATEDDGNRSGYIRRQRREFFLKHSEDIQAARAKNGGWEEVEKLLNTFATNLSVMGNKEYQSLQLD